jgi:Tfp pilus assembly protein PilW
MTAERRVRGTGVVELLTATALSLVVLGTLVGAVGSGARLLAGAGARGEVEDTAQLAVEAFTFDVRRAGYDPAAAGIAAVAEAARDHVILTADLDADGAVDPGSAETTGYACASAGRLSRILGHQSMPLADGVRRCALAYLDQAGAAIPTPATGLRPAERARVRAVQLALELRPPGRGGPTARTALVALRTAP